MAIPAATVIGRFEEAERLGRAQREVNERLTKHHRVHGVAIQCEVAEIRADWNWLLSAEPAAIERIEANQETPCVRNGRTLLVCALAHEHTGDPEGARTLEEQAAAHWMEGHALVYEGVQLELALARGDLDEVARLCDLATGARRPPSWFFVAATTALMDGLGVLRRVDELEETIEWVSRPGTLFEAYGLRALGVAREDRRRLEEAVACFESLGLEWHAAETRKLVAQA